MTLKTSQEWLDFLNLRSGELKVLDPDGWDRENFEYSWFKEKISYLEFQHRLCNSTIQSDMRVI